MSVNLENVYKKKYLKYKNKYLSKSLQVGGEPCVPSDNYTFYIKCTEDKLKNIFKELQKSDQINKALTELSKINNESLLPQAINYYHTTSDITVRYSDIYNLQRSTIYEFINTVEKFSKKFDSIKCIDYNFNKFIAQMHYGNLNLTSSIKLDIDKVFLQDFIQNNCYLLFYYYIEFVQDEKIMKIFRKLNNLIDTYSTILLENNGSNIKTFKENYLDIVKEITKDEWLSFANGIQLTQVDRSMNKLLEIIRQIPTFPKNYTVKNINKLCIANYLLKNTDKGSDTECIYYFDIDSITRNSTYIHVSFKINKYTILHNITPTGYEETIQSI